MNERCYYKKEFPVDDAGRVVEEKDVIARRGVIEEKNVEEQMYKVRDVEKGWTFWIPMKDVSVGEVHGLQSITS